MSATFSMDQRLRFADCDPAGIAYYPRYLALCDAVIEEWTEQVVGVSRRQLHFERNMGLPTVELVADFTAVSRLGDWLTFDLSAVALGRSSLELGMEVTCAGNRRFGVRYKQVLIDMQEMKAVSWPPEWRTRIDSFLGAQA